MADLIGLLLRLSHSGVEAVLVGGLAAAAHGSSLVTQDLDVCVRPTEENWRRLHQALHDLEPVHRMGPQRLPFEPADGQFLRLRNAYLSTRWGQLDALGEITGIGDYDAVHAASQVITLEGTPIRILSIPALKSAKRALGRPKDLETVRQLEEIERLSSE